jgi:sensor histidine kinase YesM
VKNKLLRTALIASPILALYGVAPIVLFNTIELDKMVVSFFFLSLFIFSFWGINIYLNKKIQKPYLRNTVSYMVTFLLHSGILFFMSDFPEGSSPTGFLIYSIIATFAINTIILIILNSEILKIKKDLAESEVQKLQVVNLEAQKQVLLQQLHPHFLFNALSTLKSLIKENLDMAENYSIKLSEFLRYSIQAHSNELVSLEDELQFTNNFIELQQVRFGKSFHCDIHISPDFYSQKLPVFALQTLVENAIKHNAFTEKNPLYISIEANQNEIVVSNNRIPKTLIQRSGTGLNNLNERYHLLSGQPIKIEEDSGKFQVTIKLLKR